MGLVLKPEYIFETSWEVCNMVGGIYTVLSTRAATLQKTYKDKLIFIGPDIWQDKPNKLFLEMPELLSEWKLFAENEFHLKMRIGRWDIPGKPVVVLVDFKPLMAKKNTIYGKMWNYAGVNSIAAFGDYDESSMFGYATGLVIKSYYRFHNLNSENKVVAQFHEWMTSFGLFYIQENVPEIATIFTTHATSIGRSIAGNHKPLYDFIKDYDGNHMAQELNMVSKHSTEKAAAHRADCFTTVSNITALECEELLEKVPHAVTPNGFEDDFIPKGKQFDIKRKQARESLRKVADTLLGYELNKDALFICTAGRYEYNNKGIDVLLESLKQLSNHTDLKKEIVAFIMVPAYIKGIREDLSLALKNPLLKIDSWNKFSTHELHDYERDSVMTAIQFFNLKNLQSDNVKVIFVPSYLNGADGIFNKTYYDLLIGMDLSVFASYYEPWGYTPLESVAFKVPTITTDLSGFGLWVSSSPQDIETGVGIIHRSDYNSYMVTNFIADMICKFAEKTDEEIKIIRKNAAEIAEKALWKHFIHYYENSYDIALTNKNDRLRNKIVS